MRDGGRAVPTFRQGESEAACRQADYRFFSHRCVERVRVDGSLREFVVPGRYDIYWARCCRFTRILQIADDLTEAATKQWYLAAANYPRLLVNPPLVATLCHAIQTRMRTGFAGLGLMGSLMAENLLRAGVPLCVFNRSAGICDKFAALGAEIALSPDALFARCDVVVLMLADDEAVDAVVGRVTPAFSRRMAGRLIINMGTHSPEYSRSLEQDVIAAGGRYVEAPVSGSLPAAREGDLVAMLAGAPHAIADALALIRPMCRETIEAGAIPRAMSMKLAVNLYLIASVTALAEATSFATRSGVDLAQFSEVITKGPLGSSVATIKLDKMIRRDFSPQALIDDVVKNARLAREAAAAARTESPLMRVSLARFEAVRARGSAALDMAAILTSYEAETLAP